MLKDKVALITGAGQGIGQGIALALAKRGVKVAALGRTVAKCEDTCRLIAEQHGTEAIALACDVAVAEDLERAVAATIERFGGIHILVNNAVSTSPGPLLAQQQSGVECLHGRPNRDLTPDATVPSLLEQGRRLDH